MNENRSSDTTHTQRSPCLCVTRPQTQVGPADDRGEVGGTPGAFCLQEQQPAEREPPHAPQRQERPQRSVVCGAVLVTFCPFLRMS